MYGRNCQEVFKAINPMHQEYADSTPQHSNGVEFNTVDSMLKTCHSRDATGDEIAAPVDSQYVGR